MKLSTQNNLRIARMLSGIVCRLRRPLGLGPVTTCLRDGIKYNLDLREGIDLSIYVFGRFEREVVEYYSNVLVNGSVAVDVGANVGAHTLRLAELCGDQGTVLAVEPTAWAFGKLGENVDLNPRLSKRIKLVQAFLGPVGNKSLPAQVYSSWPMDVAQDCQDARAEGRLHSTQGASCFSLEELLEAWSIGKIHLLKIDVDGNELDVLAGSRKVLRRDRPAIIVELAPYVYPDGEHSVRRLLQTLAEDGYSKVRVGRRQFPLNKTIAIIGLIPHQGGINCLIQ